ncbi:ABC-F family ATP-binding cassette domain-containing protein [Buchananella felis]|uniref:ABC-F family ATP-binding cassette domain-containing protein n=1 Tax=Buchananella felis TaxID=3231492 RepID=UPI003529D393
MAHLLGLNEVGIHLGVREVFAGLTLGLEDGTRVGILGPNGAGKSTLLRLLAGKLAPETGRVTLAGSTRVAMLDQGDELPADARVVDVIHPGKAEHEWATDARIRDIHAGLLDGIALDARVGELSGGQRRRVALAAVLTTEAEVLILDEPTNHLDVEGVDWLARHLRARGRRGGREMGALAVVTHDRWFLDAICTRVWEVVPCIDKPGTQIPGRVETYDGGYAAYILERAERARRAAVAEEKRNNLLRKELAWLRRGAPARTSKPKFRIDAANQLIENVPPPRDTVELMKMATARLGKDVIDLENVSLSYGDNQILREVTWRLAPGERVGIVGVNGAGKTTLLRLLEGVLPPSSGRIKRGKTVKLAVLSQSTHELDAVAHLRVVEAVAERGASVMVGDKELTASQLVERLGFARERAWTPVGEISGGERRRLQLMRLLMDEPNVLLLDEPTNDLDTDTLAAMEDLLDGWPGTLVVVSHDRYFLQRVTEHQVALLGDGSVRDLPGGVEQYLEMRQAQTEAAKQGDDVAARAISLATPGAAAGTQEAAGDAAGAGGGGGAAASASQYTPAQKHAARKAAASAERRLEKVAAQIERVHADMATASADAGKLAELQQLSVRLGELEAQRAAIEEEWLEALEVAEG